MVERKILNLSDLLSQEQNTNALIVYVEGDLGVGKEHPVISRSLARKLGAWNKEKVIGERVLPSTELEKRDFKILSAIGLLNEYSGSYELSGVAQRSLYEFI